MFKKSQDPLVESARQAMEKGIRDRAIEIEINEAFGVESRKALPNEFHADYDALISEAKSCGKIDEGLKDKITKVAKTLYNELPGRRAKIMKATSRAMQGKEPKDWSRRQAAVNSVVKEEELTEASTRKHFVATAATVKAISDPVEREKHANLHADRYARENPRFNRGKFLAACDVGKKDIKEDVEQLDELSKKTLRSYVSKASKQEDNLDLDIRKKYKQRRLAKDAHHNVPDGAKVSDIKKISKKQMKRIKGKEVAKSHLTGDFSNWNKPYKMSESFDLSNLSEEEMDAIIVDLVNEGYDVNDIADFFQLSESDKKENKYEKDIHKQPGDKISDYKEKESKGGITRSWKVKTIKEKQLDEISKKLAYAAYADSSDPDADDDKNITRQIRIKDHIKRKWGEKGGDDAEDHASAKHYGRKYRPGRDSLESNEKVRIGKSGKAHKTDVKSLKNRIKNRLKEDVDLDERVEDKLSKRQKRKLFARVDKKMTDVQTKILGRRADIFDHPEDVEKLNSSKHIRHHDRLNRIRGRVDVREELEGLIDHLVNEGFDYDQIEEGLNEGMFDDFLSEGVVKNVAKNIWHRVGGRKKRVQLKAAQAADRVRKDSFANADTASAYAERASGANRAKNKERAANRAKNKERRAGKTTAYQKLKNKGDYYWDKWQKHSDSFRSKLKASQSLAGKADDLSNTKNYFTGKGKK